MTRSQSPDNDAELIARVKHRIMEAIGQESAPALQTVRASEGVWQAVAPGVQMKELSAAVPGRPCLWRMVAGAFLPEHVHDADEEVLVLEGSLRIGTELLHAGDYHLARRGSSHGRVTTEVGCIVLLRGVPSELSSPQSV